MGTGIHPGKACWIVLGAFIIASTILGAERPVTATIKNFSAAPEFYPAPHHAQMKSMLECAEAEMLGGDQVLGKELKLQMFREDGQRELLVEAPQCLYDTRLRMAHSPGKLRVQSGDGKLSIEGTGFLFQQTNSTLWISNDVQTVVLPGLTNKSASKPSSKKGPSDELTGLEIFSERFRYTADNGNGVYSENVRVAGTNLSLTAGELTIVVPMADRELESITAEQDVIAEYAGVRATGQRMHYDANVEQMRITGQPTWQAEMGKGRADELTIDRTNRMFTGIGNALVTMPAQGPTGIGFVPGKSSVTNASVTNQTVEIACDRYELRTNSALFQKQVVVRQLAEGQAEGKMTCQLLTFMFSGTNQLQQMVAEENVLIEQQENQLSAARATYQSTNGLLELRGNPVWRAGPREGKGDLIDIDLAHDEMSVRGNASMRLPAEELGGSFDFKKGTNTLRTAGESNQVAQISSREYTLSPESARFEGKVRVDHTRMSMECERIRARFPLDNGEGERMVAEQDVRFNLTSEDGDKVQGTSAKAVYSSTIAAGVTNSVIEMSGNPMLQTRDGTIRNHLILLDVANQRVIAPGKFKMYGSIQAGMTNRVRLPGAN